SLLVILAAAAVLTAALFDPFPESGSLRDLALRPLGTALAAVPAIVVAGPGAVTPIILAHLAGGVAVLAFLLLAARRALSPRDPRHGAAPVAVLFALACAAPVWMGPLAEALAPWAPPTDWSVAVSPLSFLSVLAQVDYLSSQWFYVITPLSTLPYGYPPERTLFAVYLVAGALLGLLARGRRTPTEPPVGEPR
ncbi:MAG: hypothetical protein KDE22_13110, partial [Rhodobacterales bacterium]|nr:hypothetical protein [Rhodobacterales bacterium]